MLIVISVLLAGALGWNEPDSESLKYWGQWRGPLGTGVAPQGDPPSQWSESKNIRWKINLPGEGNGTPVVWGDRIYLTAAIPTGRKPENAPSSAGGSMSRPPQSIYQFIVLAIDRTNGKEVWRRMVREEYPHEGCHPDNTMAPHSPATNGEHVLAWFGSRGLYCLDMNGNVLWEKDFGDQKMRGGFGEGGAVGLHDGVVVVNWDHEGDSMAVALDEKTGKELWRDRHDEATSWSSPTFVEVNGKAQVILSAPNFIRCFDLHSGALVWKASGMTPNTVPSPVVEGNLAIVMSGFRGSALLAIKYKEAHGDISSGSAIAWKHSGDTPYVPSPLLYRNHLYFYSLNKAVLSCMNAQTGDHFFETQRLEGVNGSIYASPVGAGDKVYLAARDGTVSVIRLSDDFQLIARNKLDDGFDASPVIVGKELILRGNEHLYCIAE